MHEGITVNATALIRYTQDQVVLVLEDVNRRAIRVSMFGHIEQKFAQRLEK